MTGTDRSSLTHSLALTAQPVVILVNPQMGENIGAAARAMLNCGLYHLRLVAPRDGWPSERAQAMSSGALDVMPPVEVFDTLDAALADCHSVYATTARPRDLIKPVMTARSAAQSMSADVKGGKKVAILFGAERSGLSNDEVSFAHTLITIPLNPGFSSLNLGQSVLLVAYEWSQYVFEAPSVALPLGKTEHASMEAFHNFFMRIDHELESARFYRVPEMKDIISRNIRAFFTRAAPTEQEINTLHGIITALVGRRPTP